MYYPMVVEKVNGKVKNYSPLFTNIFGEGDNFDEAHINFRKKLHLDLNKLIKNNQDIPKTYPCHDNIHEKYKEMGSFKLSQNIAIKINLYTLMKTEDISREDLGKAVNINIDDLLNLTVHSHIWQLDMALKELGYDLDFTLSELQN